VLLTQLNPVPWKDCGIPGVIRAVKYYYFPMFGGIDALTLGEADTPRPGPSQILVRMRAWSLNYRDLMIASGTYGRALKPDVIPVSDGAGEVVVTGTDVRGWKVGDRVVGIFMPAWISGPATATKAGAAVGATVDGVLAEYVLFDEQAVVSVPTHLDFAEAATLPCAGVTAWHAVVERGGLHPGQTILTLGTGGVSVFAAQFAAAGGAHILATSRDDGKLDRMRQIGARDLINYQATPQWGQAVSELTNGGVDHVVEVGGAGTMSQSLSAVRIGGHISIIGVLSKGNGFDHALALHKGLSMQGLFVGSREMFEAMNQALAVCQIHPLIDTVFPFADTPAAYRHLESQRHMGKVVIIADD
jgi:NADPH:quinone reductase-like Zn-dependent oxidoreductase